MQRGRWRLPSAGTGVQHHQIIGWGFPKALEPFLDETTRTTKTGSKLLLSPVGVKLGQRAQSRAVSHPLSLHWSLHHGASKRFSAWEYISADSKVNTHGCGSLAWAQGA